MATFIQLLEQFGATAVAFFWLPVAIWTALALLVAVALKFSDNLAAVYKYHFCIAVLSALPTGILMAAFIQAFFNTAQQTFSVPVFVIQNPIPVSAADTAVQSGLNIEPAFWIGLVTALAVLIAIAALLKLGFHFVQLRLFIKKVQTEGYASLKAGSGITVLFSDRVEIPCTFGWFQKKVVLPAKFKNEPENYKMALRHELMHIRNYDNLINSAIQMVRAFFYFHPFVHYFHKRTDEYREINCDQRVLKDPQISQKKYARLLFKLSSKKMFNQSAMINMAVNPSTLRKRIQIMKKQVNTAPSTKRSFIAALLMSFAFIGFMACSDITDDGLTTGEVKEFQQQASEPSFILFGDDSPLVVLNDEIMDSTKIGIISRIKPKYIESIDVLKGEAATAAYGQKGKNGVIEIELLAKEKAMQDLKTPQAPQPPQSPPTPTMGDDVFVSVQEMPELETSRAELQSHVNYPESCSEAGIEGTVIVQFVVQPNGETTNFNVIKGIGEGCDEAAMEAIKKYAEFTPGTQDGEKVPVRMSFPITFSLP